LKAKNFSLAQKLIGLYTIDASGTIARKINYDANSLGKCVNAIASVDQRIYLATKDGIYVLDGNFNLTAHLTTMDQLPHNNIEDVFVDSKKQLLFAARTNGIYQLTVNDSVKNIYPAGNVKLSSNHCGR